MPISNYSAACSAGAVYAIITFLSRTMTACVTCVQTSRNGVTRNVFGRYEWYQPEPVVITEEEYQHINQMAGRAVERAFNRVSRLAKGSEGIRRLSLKVLAKLTCCICCVEREVRREARDKLRENARKQDQVTGNFQGWVEEMHDTFPGKIPALEP